MEVGIESCYGGLKESCSSTLLGGSSIESKSLHPESYILPLGHCSTLIKAWLMASLICISAGPEVIKLFSSSA